jgi:hypothetical protein
MSGVKRVALGLAVLLFAAPAVQADLFTGTLFYTNFTGGVNVNSVNYSYDSSTQSLNLSGQHGIASLGGADGIIFAPDGDLLVGGQGNAMFKLHTDGTGITSVNAGGQAIFHLTLDPNGTRVLTSNFIGPLVTIPLNPLGNGTVHPLHDVTGATTGITQTVFAPNGNVFYTASNPNGNGSYGRIDLNTFVTTQLSTTNIVPAHGVVFDPFTGLITMFGDGAVATFDQNGANYMQRLGINADFDQGAVDGHGHAFIAGNGQITFIDYSATHDITSANNIVRIVGGFSGIDDMAPLVGAGAPPPTTGAPAPPAAVLLASGGLSLLAYRARRRKQPA